MNLAEVLELAEELYENLPEPTPTPYTLDQTFAKFIDHTILKPEATPQMIEALCHDAARYHFASVCINPVFIPQAVELLADSDVDVCTVVGFPLGADPGRVKAQEAKDAIRHGAVEIDMVLAVGLLKGDAYQMVLDDIKAVADACHAHGALLKVIHENCLLSEEEKIIACLLSKAAGADFVKTSTGFNSGGATEAAVEAWVQTYTQGACPDRIKDGARALADKARTIRIPVHVVEKLNKIGRAERKLVTELGRQRKAMLVELHPGPWARRFLAVLFMGLLLAGAPGNAYLAWGFEHWVRALKEQDLNRELALLDRAARHSFGNYLPYSRLAQAKLRQYYYTRNAKALDKSLKDAERAERMNPLSSGPPALKGRAFLELFKSSGEKIFLDYADTAFRRAAVLAPYDIDLILARAEVSRHRGLWELESEQLSAALALEPYDLAARLRLCRSLLSQGRKNEALIQWEDFQKRKQEVERMKKRRPGFFDSSYRARRAAGDQALEDFFLCFFGLCQRLVPRLHHGFHPFNSGLQCIRVHIGISSFCFSLNIALRISDCLTNQE